MDAALFAWTMHDGDYKDTQLAIHFVLTGRYFAIGTQWGTEDTRWYTQACESTELARANAVSHVAKLERGGDTMQVGPVAITVKDQTAALKPLVNLDQPSATLDYLHDAAMMHSMTGSGEAS